MAKKWAGDRTSRLPAAQVEPYRLWFEFLRLALTDESLTVDRAFYELWGEVEQVPFDAWWADHWRHLFAVDLGVHVVDPSVTLTAAPKTLLVRLPLYQDPKVTLKQVEALLRQHEASALLKDSAEGQFSLNVAEGPNGRVNPSTRFLKNIPKVRLLLNLYRFWLDHRALNRTDRLNETACSYYNWAKDWNTKVRQGKWKRTVVDIPPAITVYVEHLDQRDATKNKRLTAIDDRSDERGQIRRFIRKAEAIASNVAKGVFPGPY